MNYYLIILFIQFFLVTLKGHNNEVRNIILIGRTGNGKSTLANILLNKNNKLEEVFKEYPGGKAGTRDTKNEIFEEYYGNRKIKYRVIDTVGLGDTNLTTQEVLEKIAKTFPFIEEGLHRIFFVIKNRFTEVEKESYRLLKETIFDNEVIGYTTIISPSFPDFENETACEEDRRNIENEGPELANIIKSTRIIHVHTPPLKGSMEMVDVNKKARIASRQKLMAHLSNCQGTYHLSDLDAFWKRIRDYLPESEKIRIELEKQRRQNDEIKRQNDEIRRQNEEARRQNEEIKRQNEETRKQNEETRRQNEETRRQNEEKRRQLENNGSGEKGNRGRNSIIGSIIGGVLLGPFGAAIGAGAGALFK